MCIINCFPTGGQGAVRPNLIDNPRFKVNQRGQSVYSAVGWNTRLMDRWKSSISGEFTCTVLNNGIRIGGGGSIVQTIPMEKAEEMLGKMVTFSVLLGGELYAATFMAPNNFLAASTVVAVLNISPGIRLGEVSIGNGTATLRLYTGGGAIIQGVKLEVGESQTLAYKDYGGSWCLYEGYDMDLDLLHCQRYFQLYSSAALRPAAGIDCRPAMSGGVTPTQGTLNIGGVTRYYNSTEF